MFCAYAMLRRDFDKASCFYHRDTETQRFFGVALTASRKSQVAGQLPLLRPPSGRNDECKSGGIP